MENDHDPNQRVQEAQSTRQEPQQAPPAPEVEVVASAPAAADAIDPAIYDRITNPSLSAEERDHVARMMMKTDERMGAGIGLGAGLQGQDGIMALLKQFLGIFGGDSFSDLRDMSGRVFEALQNGEVTEAGTMPGGSAMEGLIKEATAMAPQQPAPQTPNTSPAMQNPTV